MRDIFRQQLNSQEDIEELRSILGQPSKLAANKVIHALDEASKDFIAKSPFLVISTADSAGNCDASPRGDAPGFVHVIDDRHIFIPERPGNRRMDSIYNILSNPNIGLLFIIPGLEETLRINGKACISQDPELLELTAVNGKKPVLGIGVELEEGYVHCAKAFKRSGLWTTETWLPQEERPSAAKMLAAHVRMKEEITDAEVADSLLESYTKRLY